MYSLLIPDRYVYWTMSTLCRNQEIQMIKVYYDPINNIISTNLREMLNTRVFSCIRVLDYKNCTSYKDHIDRTYPNFSSLINKYLFSDGLDELT